MENINLKDPKTFTDEELNKIFDFYKKKEWNKWSIIQKNGKKSIIPTERYLSLIEEYMQRQERKYKEKAKNEGKPLYKVMPFNFKILYKRSMPMYNNILRSPTKIRAISADYYSLLNRSKTKTTEIENLKKMEEVGMIKRINEVIYNPQTGDGISVHFVINKEYMKEVKMSMGRKMIEEIEEEVKERMIDLTNKEYGQYKRGSVNKRTRIRLKGLRECGVRWNWKNEYRMDNKEIIEKKERIKEGIKGKKEEMKRERRKEEEIRKEKEIKEMMEGIMKKKYHYSSDMMKEYSSTSSFSTSSLNYSNYTNNVYKENKKKREEERKGERKRIEEEEEKGTERRGGEKGRDHYTSDIIHWNLDKDYADLKRLYSDKPFYANYNLYVCEEGDIMTALAFREGLKEFLEESMQINKFQNYVNYINADQSIENCIFYEVNVTLKIKKGKMYLVRVGTRQTNSLCSVPKFDSAGLSYAKKSNTCKWALFEKKVGRTITFDEADSLCREKRFPEDKFDYLDITSCLPSLSYLLQNGKFYKGDMYKWLSGKDDLVKGSVERDVIVKGCTLPALFSKENYTIKKFLWDRYRYARKNKVHFTKEELEEMGIKENILTKEMIDKNLELIQTVFERARQLNPDHNTMLFYHESNIELMIRYFLKKMKIHCFGEVYDGFYIKKGLISEAEFDKIVEDFSIIYYNNFIKGEKDVDKLFESVYTYAIEYKKKVA